MTTAEFHILVSLHGVDRHGYAIIQDVERRSAGSVKLSAGTLYRTVHRMLEEGWILELDERPSPEDDDQRRRYYRITESGERAARAEVARLAGLVKMAGSLGLAAEEA